MFEITKKCHHDRRSIFNSQDIVKCSLSGGVGVMGMGEKRKGVLVYILE